MALRATHNLAEGAGAASLAAAMKMRDDLQGKEVVCVMSGGNMNTEVLRRILKSAVSTDAIVLPYLQETRMILRSMVSALGIVVLTGSLAAGQAPAGGGQRAGGAPPAPMKNLQVLPKDMPQPEVVAIMRAFNAALGVECGHCHVWTKPGDPSNDMAADTKTEKTVARAMMQMTTRSTRNSPPASRSRRLRVSSAQRVIAAKRFPSRRRLRRHRPARAHPPALTATPPAK